MPYECEEQKTLKEILTSKSDVKSVGFVIGPEGDVYKRQHHKRGDDENEYRVRHKDYLIYDSEVRDMLFATISPVSYTHLDVYKRQG